MISHCYNRRLQCPPSNKKGLIMNNSLRLLLITAFMGLSVAACTDKDEATETAVEVPATAPAAKEETKDTTVSAGMTEAEVIAKLGEPSYTETRNLDALKITHSEWTTDAGTRSVQLHNDVVAFSQFTPAVTD